MQKYRLALVGVLGAILACAAVLAAYQWLFGERVHRRSVSPDDRWVVTVTKQMEALGSVEVRLRVVPNGVGSAYLEVHIDQRDLWIDIQPDSYEVEWISDTEFLVGDKDPGSGSGWRGRLVGEFWAVDDAP